MRWALVDQMGIVQNVVVYNGDPFVPPAGINLIEVNDWLEIGDHIEKEQPKINSGDPDPVEMKAKRDELLKDNLALIGSYEIEKKSNPDLQWSAYLDSLEQKKRA